MRVAISQTVTANNLKITGDSPVIFPLLLDRLWLGTKDRGSFMIYLKEVSKLYCNGFERVYALRDVNLSIQKGEFISILGASGSGKSTLMNILGGLDRPSCGQVLYDGKDLVRLNDREMSYYRNKKVGFVFQNYHLNSNLTAMENVMQPLVYARMPRRLRKLTAQKALSNVGLSAQEGRRPYELSGGQQQRVSIARALVNSPDIILADEPTGNLDSVAGRKIISLLSGLAQEGYTVIMVTHNPKQAVLCSRVIKIEDGQISDDYINDGHSKTRENALENVETETLL